MVAEIEEELMVCTEEDGLNPIGGGVFATATNIPLP
jgi:hypothetical protein